MRNKNNSITNKQVHILNAMLLISSVYGESESHTLWIEGRGVARVLGSEHTSYMRSLFIRLEENGWIISEKRGQSWVYRLTQSGRTTLINNIMGLRAYLHLKPSSDDSLLQLWGV